MSITVEVEIDESEVISSIPTLTPFWKVVSSGQCFDLGAPATSMIDRQTIIHELSMIQRWNGNLHFAYSVAQHSLLVAKLIPVPEWRIYGLLHDAAEAYIGDIPTPFKHWIQMQGCDVLGLERKIMNCVWEHLELPAPDRDIATAVGIADADALATEYRDVVKGTSPHWTPVGRPANKVINFRAGADIACQFEEALDTHLDIFRSTSSRGAA